VSKHRSSEFVNSVAALIGVTLVVAVVYALTAGRFSAMHRGPVDPDRVAARLAPVGAVTRGAAGTAATAPAAAAAPAPAEDQGVGAAVYSRACTACHATGAANAPRLADKAAWEPRAAKGVEALLATAITGKGAMPPRGTCADCSDAELEAAVEYMLARAGFPPDAAIPRTTGPGGQTAASGMGGAPSAEEVPGAEGVNVAPGAAADLAPAAAAQPPAAPASD
jgi:cytochrome c5